MEAAEETAKQMVIELRKAGMLKDNKKTPFQKTEALLYNYQDYKRVLNDKEKQIEEMEDNEKEKTQKSIRITKGLIDNINKALDTIRSDKYFCIIEMKYFEKQSREEIALTLDKDVKTITRNKNRLVEKLKMILFSDESIEEIFF